MKIRRVLVVYKRSSLEVYGRINRDPRFRRLMRTNPEARRRFRKSHVRHVASLERVRKTLAKRDIHADFVYRAHQFSDQKYDLVISVGGDGTFLEASHGVRSCPILGVNSDPAVSVGHLCSTKIEDFEKVLRKIESNEYRPKQVRRLRVRIGRSYLSTPVLNDILIAHRNPAATSRYVIASKGWKETQKSSGIWIAGPAGTTAAIQAAGGRPLTLTSRSFQYVVREPYRAPGQTFKLLKGVLSASDKLRIVSRMRAGMIYLDGSHKAFSFPLEESAEISADAPPLRMFCRGN